MDRWPYKDPEEKLDYGFDWASKRLEDGETIITSTWEVEEGTVEMAASPAPSVSSGVTKVWLEGGTLDETCIITNHIVTSVGRERDWSAKLKIKAK